MVFVERNADGEITEVFQSEQWKGQESVTADDAELVAYQTERQTLDAQECAMAKEDHEIRRLLDASPGELILFCQNQFSSLTLGERARLCAILRLLQAAARPVMRPAPAPTVEPLVVSE